MTTTTLTACCNTSVGVLATRPGDPDRYLFVERADGTGWAPVAGHALDTHTSWHAAVREEVMEETGLAVVDLADTGVGGWRPNRCGRGMPGPLGWGHDWRVYRALVDGTVTLNPAEAVRHVWWTGDAIQEAAEDTLTRPGIEPVWVQWLIDYGLVTMTAEDAALIDALTRPAPVRPWTITYRVPDDAPGLSHIETAIVMLTARERAEIVRAIAYRRPERRTMTIARCDSPDGSRTQPLTVRLSLVDMIEPYDSEAAR